MDQLIASRVLEGVLFVRNLCTNDDVKIALTMCDEVTKETILRQDEEKEVCRIVVEQNTKVDVRVLANELFVQNPTCKEGIAVCALVLQGDPEKIHRTVVPLRACEERWYLKVSSATRLREEKPRGGGGH